MAWGIWDSITSGAAEAVEEKSWLDSFGDWASDSYKDSWLESLVGKGGGEDKGSSWLTPNTVMSVGSGILGYLNKKEQLDYEKGRVEKKDELDRLMAIAEIEGKRLQLMRQGSGSGGGGNSKAEILAALNNGAVGRMNALSTLASTYSQALRR